ncbi:hypothetical protein N7537_002454 [Penicillium hordei]|uniref:Uncharacterized protein n=1 Tax=Penicillium hordei TaxID=40994 RepID=A0AAD6H8Q7_9EURO|nr:uncharacterized protein N7537_002454 [Penicillium hordei]KAJ5617340.1 hypothetical protein N7537_002454 [Penicillium hordei]
MHQFKCFNSDEKEKAQFYYKLHEWDKAIPYDTIIKDLFLELSEVIGGYPYCRYDNTALSIALTSISTRIAPPIQAFRMFISFLFPLD